MSDITYWVPTWGRARQRADTLLHLEAAGLLEQTVVVCAPGEARVYRDVFPSLRQTYEQPSDIHGIGQVRAWMFNICQSRYFFMMDDDVSFALRFSDGSLRSGLLFPVLLRHELHDRILELFRSYDTVGIGFRMFCQDRAYLTENKQTGWAWGYDRLKVAEDLRPCFGRLTLHEDTDWCLTLLGTGHRNVVSSYVVSQARQVSLDPTDGGCAVYRTPALVEEQTAKFLALHPGVVEPRVPRVGLPASTQYRHTVHWKRAFKERAR